MREYMLLPHGVIVTNRLHQLFEYYGQEVTLSVLNGDVIDREVIRHLNNLIYTYPESFYEIIETIKQFKKVG